MLELLLLPIGSLGVSPLEFLANIVYALSVMLAARNSIHTWWTGIVGSILFVLLFFQAKLYADVTLQLFFIVTSLLGWWQWLRGNAGEELPIQRSAFSFLAVMVLLALTVAAAYGFLLHEWTDAFAPYIDSTVLAFSILAQLLMMQRRIENWWAWLVVNTIAIPLYLSRDLHVTAFFYAVYFCNVVYGLYSWRRELAKA